MAILQEKNRTILLEYRASIVLYKFLLALKKKPDLFLLPVNICSVVLAVFEEAGIPVKFIDIDKETLCMDEQKTSEAILSGHEVIGVLFNYTYGVTYDFAPFFRSLKEVRNENVIIVEDKCLCKPDVESAAKPYVDLCLHSTGYSKYIDLDGGGYAFLFNCQTLDLNTYEDLKMSISLFDDRKKSVQVYKVQDSIDAPSYFDRLTTSKIKVQKHKDRLNSIYRTNLASHIMQLPDAYNQWRYQILVDNQTEVLKKIFANKLFASKHYKPLQNNTALFPNAEYIHNKVINLFNDLNFTEKQALLITQIINDTI